MPGCCGTWYVPTIPKYAAAPTNIKNPSQMMKTFWSAEAIISSWLNWLEIEMDGWQDEWMRERNIHNERLNHIKWDTCQNALINRIPLSVCFFWKRTTKHIIMYSKISIERPKKTPWIMESSTLVWQTHTHTNTHTRSEVHSRLYLCCFFLSFHHSWLCL